MSKQSTDDKNRAFYLAKNIAAFWARQGAQVNVKIEEASLPAGPDSNARKEYLLRSDMKNGLPRTFRRTHITPTPRILEA